MSFKRENHLLFPKHVRVMITSVVFACGIIFQAHPIERNCPTPIFQSNVLAIAWGLAFFKLQRFQVNAPDLWKRQRLHKLRLKIVGLCGTHCAALLYIWSVCYRAILAQVTSPSIGPKILREGFRSGDLEMFRLVSEHTDMLRNGSRKLFLRLAMQSGHAGWCGGAIYFGNTAQEDAVAKNHAKRHASRGSCLVCTSSFGAAVSAGNQMESCP